MDVLRHGAGAAAQPVLRLGVQFGKQIVVHQLHMEHIPAGLNVADARLPEEVHHVDALDADVSQSVQLVGIPEHTVDARAALDLVVHDRTVRALKVVLIQHHRDNAR